MRTSPALTLVVAMDENRLIATNHKIPWQLPDDVAHFRNVCAGKWLLVGRQTFEEMTGWFQTDQMPLILTSACGYDPTPGRGVASVPQAIALAAAADQRELVCIGGAQVFAAAMPEATRLLITHIEHTFEPRPRPAYFPAVDPEVWDATSTLVHPVDEHHAWPFRIVEYVRTLR